MCIGTMYHVWDFVKTSPAGARRSRRDLHLESKFSTHKKKKAHTESHTTREPHYESESPESRRHQPPPAADRTKQPHRPQQTPAYHIEWARTSIGPRQTLCLSLRLDNDVEVLSTVLGVLVGKPVLQASEESIVGDVPEPAELCDQRELSKGM